MSNASLMEMFCIVRLNLYYSEKGLARRNTTSEPSGLQVSGINIPLACYIPVPGI